MQGATVNTAAVISRPDDHSRQWTSTASSRARDETLHLIIREAESGPPDRSAAESLDPLDTMRRLTRSIGSDDAERLALDGPNLAPLALDARLPVRSETLR